jgi:serine/threonine protein kinase
MTAMTNLATGDSRLIETEIGSPPSASSSGGLPEDLLQQACESLSEAHGRGLVHRDIKPANIQVCQMGDYCDWVKVLDFGLVKTVSGNGVEPGLTAPHTVTGTPAYLSP